MFQNGVFYIVQLQYIIQLLNLQCTVPLMLDLSAIAEPVVENCRSLAAKYATHSCEAFYHSVPTSLPDEL